MKKIVIAFALLSVVVFSSRCLAIAQFPMPPTIPIWDANKIVLKLNKIAEAIFAILPSTVETETTKGIPQATTGGFIIGEKGVLLIETMLTKRLLEQQM